MCYHIWTINPNGDTARRMRRCYTRNAANQWLAGKRRTGKDALPKGMALVLKCKPGCPCGHAGA